MEYDDTGCIQVYIVSFKRKDVIYYAWYSNFDKVTQVRKLPKVSNYTKNCALVFGVRELLKYIRTQNIQVPGIVICTDQTYISDGMQTYLYTWRRNEFRNKREKLIKNHIFWKGLNSELVKMEDELGIFIKVVFEPKDKFFQKAYSFAQSSCR